MLFGNPELLNFTSEAINGSESGNTRVNILEPLEDVVVVPVPVPIPVPIPIPIPRFISAFPLLLSYSLSRLSLKSKSENAPPIIRSFFFCKAGPDAGIIGRAGGCC